MVDAYVGIVLALLVTTEQDWMFPKKVNILLNESMNRRVKSKMI